jgi:hypothetical protein
MSLPYYQDHLIHDVVARRASCIFLSLLDRTCSVEVKQLEDDIADTLVSIDATNSVR